MNENPEKTYSVQEASKFFGITEQTLRLWINPRPPKKVGKLKAEKVGNEYRIRESEINEVIKNLMDKKGRQNCRDIELIKECKSELLIMGINALGPLHQGMDEIIKRLKEGVIVKVLLLDPDSNAFLERSMEEESGFGGIHFGRLLAELQASLAICNDIYYSNNVYALKHPDEKHGIIEVRFRSEYPVKALVIIDPKIPDNARCNVNNYRGEHSLRGIEGTQETLKLAPPDTDAFIYQVQDFERLWSKSDSRVHNWESEDLSKENLKCFLAALKQPFKKAKFLEFCGLEKLQIYHEDFLSLEEEAPLEYRNLRTYIERDLAEEVFREEKLGGEEHE